MIRAVCLAQQIGLAAVWEPARSRGDAGQCDFFTGPDSYTATCRPDCRNEHAINRPRASFRLH